MNVRVCICMQLKLCQFILLHECDQHSDLVSVPIDQQMNSPCLSTNVFLFSFLFFFKKNILYQDKDTPARQPQEKWVRELGSFCRQLGHWRPTRWFLRYLTFCICAINVCACILCVVYVFSDSLAYNQVWTVRVWERSYQNQIDCGHFCLSVP